MLALIAISWLISTLLDPRPDLVTLLQAKTARAFAVKKSCLLNSGSDSCSLIYRPLAQFRGTWIECSLESSGADHPYFNTRTCNLQSTDSNLIVNGNLHSDQFTVDLSQVIVLGSVRIDKLKVLRPSVFIVLGQIDIGNIQGGTVYLVSIAGKNDVRQCETLVVTYPFASGGCNTEYFERLLEILQPVIVGLNIR